MWCRAPIPRGSTKLQAMRRSTGQAGCASIPLRVLASLVLFRLALAAFDYGVGRGAGAFLFDTNPGMIFVLRALGLSLTPVGEPVLAGDRTMQPVLLRFEPSLVMTIRRNFSAVEARPDAVGTRLLREVRVMG